MQNKTTVRDGVKFTDEEFNPANDFTFEIGKKNSKRDTRKKKSSICRHPVTKTGQRYVLDNIYDDIRRIDSDE